MTEIKHRLIVPVEATDRENGSWLYALQETRERTLRMVAGLEIAQLDALPAGLENSIGTLLYHIAIVETDYLCIDILGRDDYLPDLAAIFPYNMRDDADDKLSVMGGIPLDEHLARLAAVRARLMELLQSLTREQLDHPRLLPDWGYDISPAWTIHHLMQHEAEHRGEIGSILTLIG